MKVNSKAILWGVGIFVLGYACQNFIYPAPGIYQVYSSSWEHSDWTEFLHSLIPLFISIVPGYVAGRIANNHGILHGVIVGVLGSTVSVVIVSSVNGEQWVVSTIISNVFHGAYWYGILNAAGGGVGELHARSA